jgi:hypothetical protein
MVPIVSDYYQITERDGVSIEVKDYGDFQLARRACLKNEYRSWVRADKDQPLEKVIEWIVGQVNNPSTEVSTRTIRL